MLQAVINPFHKRGSFDLAPTGALCYKYHHVGKNRRIVLISLPQERCATLRGREGDEQLMF